MEPVNARYNEMMRQWWQFTETKLDFYDNKLKAHQDHVYSMRQYHARKDIEEQQIYNYWQGKLEVAKKSLGSKIDVYA